jgi:hypothetical protein
MTEKQYRTLLTMLKAIQKQISKISMHPISEIWLNQVQMKQIFDYSENSLRMIEPFLKISKKRGRKFYSTKSVLEYIESGRISDLIIDKKN